jgi:hypothetical protein
VCPLNQQPLSDRPAGRQPRLLPAPAAPSAAERRHGAAGAGGGVLQRRAGANELYDPHWWRRDASSWRWRT